MQNIRPSIEEVAKKVAAQFVADESLNLTDLVISAAKDAGMTSKQASALTWLSNRHAFAGRMAKQASDEFALADPGVVKLALQTGDEASTVESASPTMITTREDLKSRGQVTGQSGARVTPVEMGPFITNKLKGSDRELAGEEKGVHAKIRRILESLRGLMSGVQKVALQKTPFFSEKMAALAPEARWLVEEILNNAPFEKVAFIADSPTGRALVDSKKQDLEQACKLASEAADLRKRAKAIAADRASIQEQIALIRKEGLTR